MMIVSCSKLSILLITLLLSFSNLFFNTQALWKIPSITVKQYPMSMSPFSTYLYSHPVFRLRDTGSWSSLCFFLGWSAFLHILIILFPLSVFSMFLTQLFPSFLLFPPLLPPAIPSSFFKTFLIHNNPCQTREHYMVFLCIRFC